MEIVVILKKIGKHSEVQPIVFFDPLLGQRYWEEIKADFLRDEDSRYYDCELWQGEPDSLRRIEYLQGAYNIKRLVNLSRQPVF